MVENCLAGYNSSVFAFGQTGSGKTYTMLGPVSSLDAAESNEEVRSERTRVCNILLVVVEMLNLLKQQAGLIPRMFRHLFLRIAETENAKVCSLHGHIRNKLVPPLCQSFNPYALSQTRALAAAGGS